MRAAVVTARRAFAVSAAVYIQCFNE
eukprot:SAG31_NODE_42146_length_273_cov_0.563218_1_plen_25_part_10